MDKKIKLEFQANAVGLNKIYQDILKIVNASNLNLGDSLKQQLQLLDKDIPLFLQKIEGAVNNTDFSFIDFQELNKEFNKLGSSLTEVANKIKKSGLGMALQKELAQAQLELAKREKELEASTKKHAATMRKLNPRRDTGLSVAEENAVFESQSKKSFKETSFKLDNKTIDSYKKFVTVWEQLKEKVDVTSKEYKKYATFYDKLTTATNRRVTELQRESKEVQNTKNANSQAVQEQASYMRQLNETIQQTSGWTEEEKNIYNALTQVLTQLVEARKQQINTTEQAKTADKAKAEAAEQLTGNTRNATTATKDFTKAQDKSSSTVSKAAKQVFTYGSIMSVFRRIYQTTIQTVKDMDKALTDMAVVTSMNREEAYELTAQLTDLAKSTGQTTTEVAGITTKFLQQGKSLTQALQLTEAASRAATIAGISGSESVDLLTNAMNGFQMSASQAMEVSDKFASLAASAATNYEELATALSKVAAQANLAGLSMDFTLGLLTKGIEVTREAPETIGTALKTVISRMRELTDYGKTLEDGMDVNRVDKALKNVGVSLMDTNGQFRALEDVLTELGGKWDKLNTNQQANVAVALAGTRQQSRLIAMMQDFDRTLELVDISANSYGATMAQSADYMEGLGAATSRLTSTTQQLITDLANSDVIIGIVDALTWMVEVVSEITSTPHLMIPLLVLISGYLLQQLDYKLKEVIAQRELRKLTIEEQKGQLNLRKLAIEERKNVLKSILNKATENKLLDKEYKKELEIAAINAEQNNNMAMAAKYRAMANKDQLSQKETDELIRDVGLELNALQAEENLLLAQESQLHMQSVQTTALFPGIIGTIISSLGGLISIISIVPSILQLIIGLRKKEGKVIEDNNKKEKAGFVAKLRNAGAAMAESAAKIPVAGWVIAAAILAAIGLTIAGISASASANGSGLNSSIKETEENLNQLQADLYNINHSRENVRKLGDEFDTLSSKVFKTNEELARMEEIAQQINDEAGYTVVNVSGSTETQMQQIRGYEARLKAQAQNAVTNLNREIGAGLTDAINSKNFLTFAWDMEGNRTSMAKSAEEVTKYYTAQIKSNSAFTNAVRSIGANMAELQDVSSATSDAVLSILVDSTTAEGIITEQGVNLEEFKILLAGGGTNFTNFVRKMDATMKSGSLTDYVDFYKTLNETQKELVGNSVPVIKAIKNIGTETAKAFDQIGFSTEEMNLIMETVSTTGAAINFSVIGLENSDTEQRKEIYLQLVDAQKEYAKTAQSILNGEDVSSDLAREYNQALRDRTTLTKELQIAEAELAETDEDKDEYAEKQKEITDISEKLGSAEAKISEVENAADEAALSMKNLVEILGIVSVDDIVEDFTKLSSAIERVGQVADITNLSLKDQIDLLRDYPEIYSGIERGYLTATEAASLYQEAYNDAFDDIKNSNGSIKFLYEKGAANIVKSSSWGNYGALFEDSDIGDQLRSDFLNEDLGFDSEFVNTLHTEGQKVFGSTYSLEDARDAALEIRASVIDWNERALLNQRLTTEGITALYSEETKAAWQNATSVIAYTRASIEAKEYELDVLQEGTEEYKTALLERDVLLKQAIDQNQDKLTELDDQVKKIFNGAGQINGKALDEYVQFVNGQVFLTNEALNTLSDDQKNYIAGVISQLELLGEEYLSINELIDQDNQKLIESWINGQVQAQEAIIKTKEEEIEALEERKTEYEEYFDMIDSSAEEQERAQSKEDIMSQLSAIAGGSDAASNALRKDLLAQLNELNKEEAETKREEARNALIDSIDTQIEGLNTEIEEANEKIDVVNESLGAILYAISNGTMRVVTTTDENGNTTGIKIEQKQGENTAWTEYKPYANGGLVDYTGPAIVHGTPSKPEAFLSAKDTYNMGLLLSSLNAVIDGSFATSVHTEEDYTTNESPVTIENIIIQPQEMNNEQDFKTSGQILAEEFAKAIRQRGINVNVKK